MSKQSQNNGAMTLRSTMTIDKATLNGQEMALQMQTSKPVEYWLNNSSPAERSAEPVSNRSALAHKQNAKQALRCKMSSPRLSCLVDLRNAIHFFFFGK
jgi:hypothetical protein